MTTKYTAPTVGKAFQILRLISRSKGGLKISDLSKNLSLSKSTVHGITAALEEQGVLIRDRFTKRYSLGLTLFELGRSAYSRIDLKDAARPVIEELMQKTGESVFLGVRNGDHVTILDIVESMNDLKITVPIGSSIPLMAGAIGKAFLADLPVSQAADLIAAFGLRPHTENTITDPDRYMAELAQVKSRGYATDKEEYISGVRAVAALIKSGGHYSSVICVVGFKPSLNDNKMASVTAFVLEAAKTIGHQLSPQAERDTRPLNTPSLF